LFFGIIILGFLSLIGCKKSPHPQLARVVIVIPPHLCCDEEFFKLRSALEQNKIELVVASTVVGSVKRGKAGS